MKGIPMRFVVAVMIFFGCWSSYMLLINLSMAITDMIIEKPAVIHTDPECISFHLNYTDQVNSTQNSHQQIRMPWNQYITGQLLSAYFYGYIITQIIGGILVNKFGARLIVGSGMLLAACMTIISPVAAKSHFGFFFVVRFLLGLFQGVLFPGIHMCLSNWVPPLEKSKFTWSLLGGTAGALFTWPFCGMIIKYINWETIFFLTGSMVLVWSVLWMILVTNTPSSNRFISQVEREYIEQEISTYEAKKVNPGIPWLKIISSRPFLALMALHFSNAWGINFIQIEGPIYLREVLGFGVIEGGSLACLPYLVRLLCGFLFSTLGNIFVEHHIASITALRKGSTIFSHLFPASLMLLTSLVGCYHPLSICLIVFSFGFNGASVGGVLANAKDLAPNFSNALFNISMCIGTPSGFIIPTVVGCLIEKYRTMEPWKMMFIINAVMYACGGFLYLLFGKAQVQPWND